MAAPVTLLAQGYSTTFGSDLECNTLRATFHIPVNENQSLDVTFGMNKFNMVVVEEASLVSPESFNIIAGTFNCLNCPPIVAITGDKHQQQPLKTVHSRVSTTVSILNDHTFNQNSKHALHQQFRILDKDYVAFTNLVHYVKPTQQQLHDFQQSVVLCESGFLDDEEIYHTFQVSRRSLSSL